MSTLIERMTSAGSEGARRATGDLADGGAAAGVRDPEVSEKAKRRRFSAEYKLRIVREADACKGDGDVAALLRREGLYSSHLSSWRRQRDEIAKAGLTSRKRGRKAKAEAPRIKELERENARLQRRLARVETMLEIQKKASELLGVPHRAHAPSFTDRGSLNQPAGVSKSLTRSGGAGEPDMGITERNHQGLGNELLTPLPASANDAGPIVSRERLGGILNYYCRAA